MKRFVVLALIAAVVAALSLIPSQVAGASNPTALPGPTPVGPPPPGVNIHRVHPAKHHCYTTVDGVQTLRRAPCPSVASPNVPAPLTVGIGVTPFPINQAVPPLQPVPWMTSTVNPHVDFGFGWLIYAHWTHAEVGSITWIGLISGVSAVAGWACAGMSLLAPVCVFLFAVAGAFMLYLFQTAWNRGGGIVLEFTYGLAPWGYEYVGNNYRS